MKKFFLPLLFIFILTTCKKNKVEPYPVPEGTVGSTVLIDESGGEVAVPTQNTSVTLIIPPGALTSPTEITVYTPEQSSSDEIRLGFEPDGLEFLKPVTLNVSLSQDLFTSYALTSLWNISELNDLVDVGSEEYRWQRMANVEIGPSGNTISGEMDHFSTGFVLLGIERIAYLVMDLPGKYLLPGDGLFVMSTGGANYKYDWVPGHVGIVNFIDKNDNSPDAGLMVLESTINGGPSDNIDGVQLNPFLRFKRTSGHLYMGARRPIAPPLVFTDPMRIATVAFARSKLGEGYDWLGGVLPNHWSCSELVEDAWDAAAIGVFGNYKFFPTPVEMFEKTVEVSEITVKVGEEVKIPVYPVVIDKSSNVTFSTGYYLAGNPITGSTISLLSTPLTGSSWAIDNNHVYHANTFTWTPKAADAGTTDTLIFQMTGTVNLDAGYSAPYNIIKQLIIHVQGVFRKINITPVQMGQTGLQHSYFFPIPTGAEIGPNSQDHLIDSATGLYPVNPIFQDQELDNYEEGWLDSLTKTHYGVRFHLSRLDWPYNPAPTGSHTWIYYLDYGIPHYYGN